MRNYIILGIVCFLIGFTISKTTVKEKVVYIKGETTSGSIATEYLKPTFTYKAKHIDLPMVYWRTDTIVKDSVSYIKVPDTIMIFNEFLERKEYEFNVFDDNRGTLDIRQSIQFNKLSSFDYTFTPIIKQVVRERTFEPFVLGSWNDVHGLGLGGGVFIKKTGLSYKYNFDKSFDVSLYQKF